MDKILSAEEWFENNFDCYADTWIIENGCTPKEGDVIMAMTKDKFLEIQKQIISITLEAFAEELKKENSGYILEDKEVDQLLTKFKENL